MDIEFSDIQGQLTCLCRCKVARMWSDTIADLAQELEDKSGGVIVSRSGSRICLFRGYTQADIPSKTHIPKATWKPNYDSLPLASNTPQPTGSTSVKWWEEYKKRKPSPVEDNETKEDADDQEEL